MSMDGWMNREVENGNESGWVLFSGGGGRA